MFCLVEEDIESGYVAKALRESFFAEAETLEDLKLNICEVVNCHFEDDERLK